MSCISSTAESIQNSKKYFKQKKLINNYSKFYNLTTLKTQLTASSFNWNIISLSILTSLNFQDLMSKISIEIGPTEITKIKNIKKVINKYILMYNLQHQIPSIIQNCQEIRSRLLRPSLISLTIISMKK